MLVEALGEQNISGLGLLLLRLWSVTCSEQVLGVQKPGLPCLAGVALLKAPGFNAENQSPASRSCLGEFSSVVWLQTLSLCRNKRSFMVVQMSFPSQKE